MLSPRGRQLVLITLFLGMVIGLVLCVCFGILDLQCGGDPRGRYWNASTQKCQAVEVSISK